MKTKRHPGNHFRYAIALFFALALSAAASVTARLDNPAVYRGEPVTLTLSATGDDIEFPPLRDIAGFPIQSRGTSRSLSIVNGHTTRTVEQRLVFTPDRNVTIPAFDITVDGRVEHTLPLHVRVLEPTAAPQGAPMRLLMKLEKERAYVGEPVRLDLIFKIKPGTPLDDLKIAEPKFEDFWIKQLNAQPAKGVDKDGYITRTFSYLLFAQKSGDLTIPPVYANVGTRVKLSRGRGLFDDPFFSDPFFNSRLQYKKLYSNPATLHVEPLPQGLEVYGDFTLHAEVDKHKVAANKPVNLHIHIEGEGNVEDIAKFEPQMDDAVVYANDPKTESYIKHGKYFGTFDQTIAIIPDRNVTIPPLAFRYFDSRTKTVVTKHTPPFDIEVTGAAPRPSTLQNAAAPIVAAAASAPKNAPANGRINRYEAAGIFAGGFVTGGLFLWLVGLWRKERPKKAKPETPLAKRIRGAKNDRELFDLLLPLKGTHPAVDDALEKLEANLYRSAKHTIGRKRLAEALHDDGHPVEFI